MIVNKENGDVMGIRSTRIIQMDYVFACNAKDPGYKRLCAFNNYADSKVNFFDIYPVKECFYYCGLGVGETYRQQGLAEKMMRFALKFFSQLGINDIVIKGEGSSVYSKRVYEKCGFETLYDLPFTEYKVDGQIRFQNDGLNTSMKGYGLHMTNCNLSVTELCSS